MIVNQKENPADLKNLKIKPVIKEENSILLKKENVEVKPVPDKTTEQNLASSDGIQNIKNIKSENEKPLNERPKSEGNVKKAENPHIDINQAVNSTPTAVINQGETEVNKNSSKIDSPTSNENILHSDSNISEKEKQDSKRIKSEKEINVRNLNIKENSENLGDNQNSKDSEGQDNAKTGDTKPALDANKEFYDKLKVNEKIAVNILKETEKIIKNENQIQPSLTTKSSENQELNKEIPSRNQSSTSKPSANEEPNKVIPSQHPSLTSKHEATKEIPSQNQSSIPKPSEKEEPNKVIPSQNQSSIPKPSEKEEPNKVIPPQNQSSIPKPSEKEEPNKVISSENQSSTHKPSANEEPNKVISSENQSSTTTVISSNKKENESFAYEAKSYLNNFLDHPFDVTKNLTSFVIKPFNSIYNDLSKPNEKANKNFLNIYIIPSLKVFAFFFSIIAVITFTIYASMIGGHMLAKKFFKNKQYNNIDKSTFFKKKLNLKGRTKRNPNNVNYNELFKDNEEKFQLIKNGKQYSEVDDEYENEYDDKHCKNLDDFLNRVNERKEFQKFFVEDNGNPKENPKANFNSKCDNKLNKNVNEAIHDNKHISIVLKNNDENLIMFDDQSEKIFKRTPELKHTPIEKEKTEDQYEEQGKLYNDSFDIRKKNPSLYYKTPLANIRKNTMSSQK